MKILHMVPLINASVGGPSVSVTRLATEQAKLGHEVTLACLDYDHLGPQVPAPGVRLLSQKGNFLAVHGRGWSPAFRRLLRKEARRHDVVHDHGLWMWPNKYARCAANEAGKPLVISTRGMLEGWSLGRSVGRKFVAWHLFERKNLESAALFHATSESEAEAIATALRSKLRSKYGELSVKGDRRWEIGDRGTDSAGGGRREVEGNCQPRIVVAPNGVDVPEKIPGREVVQRRFPRLKGKEWVLFMSRIHPKKGIDLLLQAWKEQMTDRGQVKGGRRPSFAPNLASSGGASEGSLREERGGMMLVIAGADLIGYGAEVERIIREQGLGETVLLTGHVDGEVREALLGNAKFFVLPSYSENFGLVVAESLAAGRPVLTTTGTPWGAAKQPGDGVVREREGEREGERERGPSFAPNLADSGGATEGGYAGWDMNLERNGCGVICEVGGLKEALGRMLRFSDEQLDEMGRKGKKMVAERFSWKAAAEKVVEAYKELVDRR